MLKRLLPILIIFLVPLILVFIWFRDGNIMGTAEAGVPFYHFGRYFEVGKYAWTDAGLGNSTNTITASKLLYFVLSQIESWGVPGYLLQASFLWLILVSSGVGVYLLIRELYPKMPSMIILAGVLFYWFNPISLVNTWNRFLNNHLFFFAFLPLACFVFIRGIRLRDFRYCIYLSILSIFFCYSFISPAFNILLWAILTYIWVFLFLVENKPFDRKVYLFYLLYFIANIGVFSLFNFWWMYQFLTFYSFGSYQASADTFFSSQGNILTLSVLSQELGYFSNNLRFMHGTFFDEGFVWRNLYNHPLIVFVEFLLLGLILFGIYKGRRIKEVLLVGLAFLTAPFLMKGSDYPFGELFQVLFTRFPIIQVFRNPFEKLGFILALSATPLFAFGLYSVWTSKTGLVRRYSVILFFILFVAVFWGYAYYSGDVFTASAIPANQRGVGYKVKVPDYYKEISDWLRKEKVQGRVLVLPIGGEGITHKWEKGYTGIDIYYALISTPTISYNSTIPNYYDLVEEIKKYQLNEEILNFARFINAEYIIWRGDIEYKERGMPDPVHIKERLDEWTTRNLLVKEMDKGSIAVYKIPERYVWPRIYSTSSVFYSDETDLSKLSKLLGSFPNKVAFVKFPEDKELDGQEIIKPLVVFTPQINIETRRLSDEDLLARLFHAQHLPDDQMYTLIRLKEFLQTPPKSDYWGHILYESGRLGKRVVEIYKMRKANYPEGLTQTAEDSYLRDLRNHHSLLKDLASSQKDVRAVILESLAYQATLLERSGSELTKQINSILVNLRVKPSFNLPETMDGDYVIHHYSVPRDGVYRILSSQGEVGSFYLDGVLRDTQELRGEIYLSKGVHEIARIQRAEDSLIILDQSDVRVADGVNWENTMNLDGSPSLYRIEFDYIFNKGRIFKLDVTQNTEKKPETNLFVVKDDYNHGWRHFDENFRSYNGARSAIISMSPTYRNKCEKNFHFFTNCIEVINKYDAEIKNLKVVRIDHQDIYLKSGLNVDEASSSANTSFVRINPTEYEVTLEKSTSTQEVLVFSELFDLGWELVDKESKARLPFEHVLVNDYANGWVIDKPGSYRLVLRFKPQEGLELSYWVSIISVLVGIGWLLISKRYARS